jgi:hypothetical protein
VRKTVITTGLSEKEINSAIVLLKNYKGEFLEREKRLVEGLAQIGLKEASVRFTTAMYDGTNDVSVHLDATSNGYVIVADGKAVAFIEFGAGVYHNGSEPYPNPRPSGVVNIGEYGAGHGKRKAWGYMDESNELVITRGNPAAMPMWYASEDIKRSVLKVVKEVFG